MVVGLFLRLDARLSSVISGRECLRLLARSENMVKAVFSKIGRK
jgi:hypothetical protein